MVLIGKSNPYMLIQGLKAKGYAVDKVALETGLSRANLYKYAKDPQKTSKADSTTVVLLEMYIEKLFPSPFAKEFVKDYQEFKETRNSYQAEKIASKHYQFCARIFSGYMEDRAKTHSDSDDFYIGSAYLLSALALHDLWLHLRDPNVTPSNVEQAYTKAADHLKLATKNANSELKNRVTQLHAYAVQSLTTVKFMALPKKERGCSNVARQIFKQFDSLPSFRLLLKENPHNYMVARSGLNVASIMQSYDDCKIHSEALRKVFGDKAFSISIHNLSPIDDDSDMEWFRQQDLYTNTNYAAA